MCGVFHTPHINRSINRRLGGALAEPNLHEFRDY
jgi:hypothetical protein